MNRPAAVVIGLGLFAAGAGAGWYVSPMKRAPTAEAPPATSAPVIDGVVQDASGRRVLYWHDPMVPQHRFQKPGKSPFMNMQLVPVYASGSGSDDSVTISARTRQNLGIRTGAVTTGTLQRRLEGVGTVEYNERTAVTVQQRAGGFVERVHVRAPFDRVRKDEPLVELFVPEWAAAQREFLFLVARDGEEYRAIIDAARERLRLLGIDDAQIAAIERTRSVQAVITLRAPIEGVVVELGVREGMTVPAGAMLYRLVGVDTVWINAEVPEIDAAHVRVGQPVEVRMTGAPNRAHRGTVTTVLPEANAPTRTLRARIEIANPDGILKAGMFANIVFGGQGFGKQLVVPSEAVIRTGHRSVVIVSEGEGHFRPVDVQPGEEADGQVAVRGALEVGEQVVVSGQFLIDSEASLKGVLSRMINSGTRGAREPIAQDQHGGTGKVEGIDRKTGEITLQHAPMPGMGWPAMTMSFRVANERSLDAVRVGDAVEFTVRAKPDQDGEYVITRIGPRRAAP